MPSFSSTRRSDRGLHASQHRPFQLWANTGLKPSEFSTPVLGLIFLRYADTRYAEAEAEAEAALAAKGIAPEDREPMDYQAEGVLYLHEEARFSYLQSLTEGANLGHFITNAMIKVEEHNPELRGVLFHTTPR
ncbi:type I restriction-modification system subunit M N-terminal domain-containing protein [Metallibacterium sp.]|uniref:type I restriction-modification system subunit M N-terminal domain-containing protein n=1 Tax=Metallibacterium sp. TaxID=2940281 RepID=UPI0031BA6F41